MSDFPDLSGFADAQQRLVEGLGTSVTFRFVDVNTYASGVYIDPQTGLPLDPTVTASASSPASASIILKATVIRRTPQLTSDGLNDGDAGVAGIIPAGKAWLRIPAGHDPNILFAKYVDIGDESFLIERFVYDGIGLIDRLYVECEFLTG